MKRSRIGLVILLGYLALIGAGCSRKPAEASRTPRFGPQSPDAQAVDCEPGSYGGNLIIAINTEPRSFNRIMANEQGTTEITDRINAPLIALNRSTQRPEPALAKSWSASEDGKVITVRLRQGLNFSDGAPFTADDVIFTFTVLFNPRIKSPQAQALMVDGQPPRIEKMDSHTVQFVFPKPLVTFEQVLDMIYMLPRHRLESAYRAGKFETVWNKSTPPQEIVGLGPFKIKEYISGQRIILERNLHYWKVDKKGRRLPYLDQITILFVPDPNARVLRFQTGELDAIDDIRPEDFARLKKLEREKGLQIIDAGPALGNEFLWFNMNPEIHPQSKTPYVDPAKFQWFSNVNFRRAVSYAIDREGINKLVFLGKSCLSYGPISPSNKFWFNPQIQTYDYNPEKAKALLQQAGFRYQPANQILQDAAGREVAFTLVTNASNSLRQKMGSMIQQDLAKIGIKVSLAALEMSALVGRLQEFNYEACLMGFHGVDTDPANQMNVWLSSAPMHQWYPNQKKPATPWEARIDSLMLKNISTTSLEERKRTFAEVQQIMADNVPFIYLISKNVLVGIKEKVKNVKPTVIDHRLLWNCEELYLH